MKTIGRILIILMVAGAIVGLTLLVVNVSGMQASQPFARGEGSSFDGFSSEAGQANLGPGQFTPGFERGELRPDGERGTRGVFSPAETLKNIAIVAVIVAIFAAVERLLKVIRGKRFAQAPVSISLSDRKE